MAAHLARSEGTSAPTIQECRSCGGGAPVDVHFCPQCTKILKLGRQGDYFSFFGIPRRMQIDTADLERRFRLLSRQFHPDYFYHSEPSERLASLERSSYLNDAYRTLKQPISRIEYLLEREGAWAPSDRGASAPGDATGRGERRQSMQPPAALLEEVFALNEELDEVRELRASGAPAEQWRSRLQRAAAPIEAKRIEHERQLQELSARWDALADAQAPARERQVVLEALRDRMLERHYISNLLETIEGEMGGASSAGSDARL